MADEGVNRSKYLSWILRHRAPDAELAKDEAGWVSVEALLKFAELTRADLEEMARSDSKRRIQLVGDQIRACQGHSADSGVTPEALEASWAEYDGDAPIWHGTRVAAVEQIAQEGLKPGARTHVHCAPAPDSLVGKRGDSHVLLEISPPKVRAAGLGVFVAPNGVILVRHVPKEAIIGMKVLTKEARKREHELRRLFHLP